MMKLAAVVFSTILILKCDASMVMSSQASSSPSPPPPATPVCKAPQPMPFNASSIGNYTNETCACCRRAASVGPSQWRFPFDPAAPMCADDAIEGCTRWVGCEVSSGSYGSYLTYISFACFYLVVFFVRGYVERDKLGFVLCFDLGLSVFLVVCLIFSLTCVVEFNDWVSQTSEMDLADLSARICVSVCGGGYASCLRDHSSDWQILQDVIRSIEAKIYAGCSLWACAIVLNAFEAAELAVRSVLTVAAFAMAVSDCVFIARINASATICNGLQNLPGAGANTDASDALGECLVFDLFLLVFSAARWYYIASLPPERPAWTHGEFESRPLFHRVRLGFPV